MRWLSSLFRNRDPVKVFFRFSKENDFVLSVDATYSLKTLSQAMRLEGVWTDGSTQAIHPQYVVACREGLLRFSEDQRYEISIDPRILQLDLLNSHPDDFRFSLAWDREQMEAVCFPPDSSEVWENGWFLFNDRIFQIRGWTAKDNIWIQSPIPATKIVEFLSITIPDALQRGIPIDSSIKLRKLPIFHLDIVKVTEVSILMILLKNCRRPEIVPGIEDYVLADNDQFFLSPYQNEIEQFLLSCEKQGRDRFILKGQQIPYLLDHIEKWSSYIRGDVDALHSMHRIIRNFELSLEAIMEYHKGIGSVYGMPVIGTGDQRMKALELHFSYRAHERYIFHPNGWIPVRILANQGLLDNALSIAKVELTPDEIVQQRSNQFEQFPFISDLPTFPAMDAASHLKALLQCGLQGGVACGERVWLPASYHILMDLIEQHPDFTILLMGPKNQLERFERGWTGSSITWIKEEDRLEAIPTLVAVTPYIAGKNRFIQDRNFDICIFLAPEEVVKTEANKTFEWMCQVRARLRLSFYVNPPEAINMKIQASILGYQDPNVAQQLIYPAAFGKIVADIVQEETESVYLQTPEQIFVAHARQFEEAALPSGGLLAPDGYEGYLPQFTAEQASWYFYWRAETRAGRYHKTSLPCIFMYIYELINGIGWIEPIDGQRQLISIWNFYRNDFPELASYLMDWIADFSWVYGVEVDHMEVIAGHVDFVSTPVIDAALMQRLRDTPARIPFDIITQLYNEPTDYIDSIKEQMEFHLPRVIGWCSTQLHKDHGVSLAEQFQPAEVESVQRNVFRHALYAGSQRTVLLQVSPYRDNKPFRDWITSIIRYSENKIRFASNMKARYRQTALAPGLQQHIDQYFTAHQAQVLRKERNIRINQEVLLSLQEDTEQVQQMLATENVYEPLETNEDQHPLMMAAQVEEMQIGSKEGSSWEQLRQRLHPKHLQLLTLIKQSAPAAELVQAAAAHGTMLELLLDEVNDIAMETLGDLLIDGTVIVEEYRELINFG
ncbi:TerB N-terminal domain-containing protein [Paenibacillus enshidis]|uniref:TerB N-terminal domain-containing protein n=1 Tax=Paenibacillus enshidis TaxID=1458439 RepID=A0ABV5AVH3_9BACL